MFSQLSRLLIQDGNVNHSAAIMNLQISTARPVRVRVRRNVIDVPEARKSFSIPQINTPEFQSTVRYYDGISTLEMVQQIATDGPTVSPLFLSEPSVPNKFSRKFENDVAMINDALARGINVYELNLPHLCELRLRTTAFNNLKGFRLVTLISRLLIHAAKLGIAVPGVIAYLNTIEAIYCGAQIRGTPGHVIVCPPGVGKTTTELLYSFGYLDTDFVNKDVLFENPVIIDNLVKAGISIFTNLWNWRQFKVRTFGILPNDLKAALESKYIFPSTLDEMRRKALMNLAPTPGVWRHRHRNVRFDQEEWIAAFADMANVIPTYVGFIEDGLMTHYLSMVNGC